jgi:addiction module RelE/StbE family toxin
VAVLEWRQPARDDLLAIIDYISDDNPDAAQRLKDEIEAKTARLPKQPLIYRKGRVAGTREMVVRRNYIVIYAVDARAVSILRVLHAARQWPPVQRQT